MPQHISTNLCALACPVLDWLGRGWRRTGVFVSPACLSSIGTNVSVRLFSNRHGSPRRRYQQTEARADHRHVAVPPENQKAARPPQTPPGRSPPTPSQDESASTAGGRALRLPKGAGRDTADIETFLESLTPVDIPYEMSLPNKENDVPDPRYQQPQDPSSRSHKQRDPRDSHDLSLPARQVTRDSLVANMLLSLDQMSMGQIGGGVGGTTSFGGSRTGYDDPLFSSFGDDNSRTMTFNSRTGRTGHGYSYSSDLEGADDASRMSSRGRRSNSSSGYQSNLGRINSMRETGTSRAIHSRGGKGSKSSSTNSIDQGYAQVLGSQRWARGFGRSSSFDGAEAAPRQPPAPGPWHIEFSNTFFNKNEEYEAAPMPTIPAGPRRLTTVPSLPVMPPPEPKITEPKAQSRGPSVERRRSIRSSKSATINRKPDPMYNTVRDAPPVPALELDSAPAPHIGYEKSKDAGLVPPPANMQPKEKQGFFRRMFGSTKTALTPSISTPPATPATPAASSLGLPSKSSAPPSRESHQSTTHTLQKKTSSFFRRRKYSITDTEPPPVPVVQVPQAAPTVPVVKLPIDQLQVVSGIGKAEPSPITSLRRAMDPFLAGSPTSTAAQTPVDEPMPSIEAPESPVQVKSPGPTEEEDRGRTTRGFSPDYEPSPKAVIRKVDPEPSDPAVTPSRPPATPLASPPKSFLREDSDDEDSPVRHRKAPQSETRNLKPGAEDNRTRSPSPTVSKSKSVPNLNMARKDLRLSIRQNSDTVPSNRDSSNTLGLPLEKPSVPSFKIESAEPSPKGESIPHSAKSIDEPDFVMGDPTEDDRQKAQKIYDGNEDFIQKDRAAAYMGEEGPVRQRVLRAYMDLFDFGNQSIVNGLRLVCNRLLLRAETQQVDRILVAFTKRWCDCNPNHGFKIPDVIHTICYSIILLNTDLHIADIEHRMSKPQFVKNTMTTIRQALQESAPEVFNKRASILPGKGPQWEGEGRTSEDQNPRYSSFRASFKPPPRPGSALGTINDSTTEGCGPLVKAPFDGPLKAWEQQVETVLKETYSSIRDDRLPLFGAEASSPVVQTPNSLSVMGMLKRSPSVLSKAPSEGVASARGRIADQMKPNSRWNSKSRSRPRGFGNGFSSSRTSFDDGTSVWSPTDSSATWSKVSLGRTHTSMSMDSFGSSYPRGDYQQSIGFASALSQAIIREDNADDGGEIHPDELLDDESLELAGPPWIKEGIVSHKHFKDGNNKKPKNHNWTEVFAVIQKGQLSLFSFSPNKSMRQKNRRGPGGTLPKGAVVGGGNWQDHATNLGSFSLRQTLATAFPPGGYSHSRKHVWILNLPTGGVHFFHVGTAEISAEFVSTANYWSARLSTVPLIGGISNIEYGWSDAVINNALVTAINESTANLPSNRPPTSNSSTRGHSRSGSAAAVNAGTGIVPTLTRSSMQSGRSIRSSSFDFGGSVNRPGSGSSGVLGNHAGLVGSLPMRHSAKLPGDRIHIADWTPPQQSTRPSNLSEKDQLGYLQGYIKSIEAELQSHNALRSPMLLAFTPRSTNAVRAMANWERKSEYLLHEIVKFRTYAENLEQATVRRGEIYKERDIAKRAARGEEVDLEGDGEVVEGTEEKKEEGVEVK
ncbi:hypothetical protein B0T21DRAFT_296968 [Apiosordaria backusii]|uniref:SEC7 domain-containing protein n=1 Tax=Apiosordaria backusii TaxID=314023 RepID=A0AA40AEK8_9PEZI|nr:hypothetical protein B0T21DRAFT_296968 [Apiosordaria backusii]